jgi:hypothetical protein
MDKHNDRNVISQRSVNKTQKIGMSREQIVIGIERDRDEVG